MSEKTAPDSTEEENQVQLSVKELLNVSSDWKQVNNLKMAGELSPTSPNSDFQSKQIERIFEAIALTLPTNHAESPAFTQLASQLEQH